MKTEHDSFFFFKFRLSLTESINATVTTDLGIVEPKKCADHKHMSVSSILTLLLDLRQSGYRFGSVESTWLGFITIKPVADSCFVSLYS
jgi:hypothetical protein